MANKGIPLTNSMFACLALEEEQNEKKPRRKRNPQEDQSKKKGDKNGGRSAIDEQRKQLQQMAFGKPGSAGKKNKAKNSNANNVKKDDKNWNQWKEHDQEVASVQYQEDLEKAILASQVELEKTKSEEKDLKKRIDDGLDVPKTKEEKKKRKQKDKIKPMSLGEFNQMPAQTRKDSNSDDSDGAVSPPPVHYRVPSTEQDSKFFNNVHNEAEQILRQDKMQEEYRKTFSADNVVVAKLKNDIELRDKKIDQLKSQMEKMLIEMKQVKTRNKQLCGILAQGEMKDKAQVLLQVDQLNEIKDELMEQVSTLTSELEKERTKNRALKTDSDRKTNKHGK